MTGQMLFLLFLGVLQILGAPTKERSPNSGNDGQHVENLSAYSGNDSPQLKSHSVSAENERPLTASQVTDRAGRLIPLLIYDDGQGTSHLAPAPAAAATKENDRVSGYAEAQAFLTSLFQSFMDPMNFYTGDQTDVRALGKLKLPLLGAAAAGLIPNLTFPVLSPTAQANLRPVLADLITMFPFLPNLPGFSQVNALINPTRSQGVYLFTPITGLIPVSNITPRSKTARDGLSQSSSVELLQKIYNAYQQSLLQQQALALQSQSLYGNPSQTPFTFNPGASNPSPFSYPSYGQPLFGPSPYSGPINYSPPNNPFLNLGVQPIPSPSVQSTKSPVSELPFQLLKEVSFEELLELESEKNEGQVENSTISESKNEEEEFKVPVIAPEDHKDTHGGKKTEENTQAERDANHDNPGQQNPTPANAHPSQMRENSKFAQRVTPKEENYFPDNTGRFRRDGPMNRAPLLSSYTLNRSL